jgi:anti-sigma-K factor RskA
MHEQAAGFALDALGPAETGEFERHLRVCPGCEDELERLGTAAAALAFACDPARPRPELRLRVLDRRGGVVVPLRRRRPLPLLAVGAVAAACAAAVIALNGRSGGHASVAGLRAYGLHGAAGALLVAGSGEAVLVVRGLPAPAAGTAYELWVVRGGTPAAAGFLRGRLGLLTRPVPPGSAVAVSLEPRDGSRRPTGPLLLTADTA